MSRISPKLIDIEGNRIETDDITGRNNNIAINTNCYGVFKMNGSFDDKWKGGRFPTQLITNILDEKYKYVKRI